MASIKDTIETVFDLNNNQANLLMLSVMTAVFQGFVYFMIDKTHFTPRYFVLTLLMSFIYNIFYYKTYLGTKKN